MFFKRLGFVLLAGLAACGPDAASPKVSTQLPPPPVERLKAAPEAPVSAERPNAAPEAAAPKVLRLGKDPAGCTWLRSEGTVVVGENDSPSQAGAAAIAQARIAAMQDFLGVKVRSRYLDFQQEGLRDAESLTENILQTTREGRILKEEIEEKGYRSVGDCQECRYYARLRTCILPTPDYHDKDFHVELNILGGPSFDEKRDFDTFGKLTARASYVMATSTYTRTDRFVENQITKLTVSSTRDCFIYLYDVYYVGGKKGIALLVPNERVRLAKVAAGDTWEYPAYAEENGPSPMIAELPEGRPSISAETIRLIASKVPLPFDLIDPSKGGFSEVLLRMNASKMDFEEDAKAFTIYKTR